MLVLLLEYYQNYKDSIFTHKLTIVGLPSPDKEVQTLNESCYQLDVDDFRLTVLNSSHLFFMM